MKFSIITINYNNCEGLGRTLESVVNQTCRDFEYIVIDGGSTDGSKELIEQYADRIDYWVSEPDKGIYNAMNKGIAVAKGEYCNFMNSGDTFVDSGVLEHLILKMNDSDVIAGRTHAVSKTGTGFETLYIMAPPQDITAKFFIKGTLNHQATFIKTKLLKENNYREDLKIVSDWAFFFDVLILGQASYQRVELDICNYDMQGISSSVNLDDERRKYLHTVFTPLMADYFDDRNVLEEILYNWGEDTKCYKIATAFCLWLNKVRSLIKK